jgi:LuxR family transcriptional regulator, maltose regulon positive regulatory protein
MRDIDRPIEPVLVESKLHAPRQRPGTVDRTALLSQLNSHPGPVLVVAPPGFGKSTLLAEWDQQDGRPFAWLSLDAGDNDPIVFWSNVTEAVRVIDPRFAADVEPAFRVPGTDLLRGVVPQLMNELGAIEGQIVLVLDDYQSITDPTCHRSVELLLERRPSNVGLVIATRSDPPFPLGRLRAGGDLLELRASELGFTRSETEGFLNEEMGLHLSGRALTALQERTEGWPAGLYLAYLSIRDATDPEGFVAEFGGSSRHIVDYLTEVVLDTLDRRSRDFLLETSILEQMSGPLCDAVTDHEGSSELLLELEHANHFLIALDDRREWYRYHRLFADLLHDELLRRAPDRVPELHRRASRWLASAGHLGSAIRHALAGGELEVASRLVAEHYLMTIEWGGFATVAGWLESFPREAVVGDARLSVVEAWVMSFLNRRDEAEWALQNAANADYEGPLPDGASSVEASAVLLRAGFPWGDVGRMKVAARRAFELEGRQDSMWSVTVHVQLGWALVLSGDFEAARPYLLHAARVAPVTGQWLNAFGAVCLLASVCLEAHELDEAERWARDGLQIAEDHGLSETAPGGWAYAAIGEVLARDGRIDQADHLLSRGVEQLRLGAQPLLLIQALLGLATVRRALGASADARAILAEARAMINDCADPGILAERLEVVAKGLSPAYRRLSGLGDLTDRELEVLRLLEKDLSKREIGSTLFLSYNTIHSHTRSIYRKLNASSRVDAIARARELGLL